MSFIHLLVALVVLLVAGLVTGMVARLVMPGRTTMSVRATAALGLAGSFIGALVLWFVTDSTAVTAPYGFLAAIAGSIAVLALCRVYLPSSGKSPSTNA